MNRKKIELILTRFRDLNPNPTTELEYSTPFELLLAVMLSAQMTDKGVNLATRRLFPVANTPQAIVVLGETKLAKHLSTINFFKTKARNVIATSKALLEQHGGEVPRDRDALEALPGVGRKTANVILNTAFGESAIAVDTHIFRVSNRTGLAPGANPLAVEEKLDRVVPDGFKRNVHHWLILHGRYVCVARKPKCPECIIRDLCEYDAKTQPDEPESSSPAARKVAKRAAKRKVRINK